MRNVLERERAKLSKILSENKRLEHDLKSATNEIEERKKETDRLKHEAKLAVIKNLNATKYINVTRKPSVAEDESGKDTNETHEEEDQEIVKDWTTGEFTRSRVVKKATTFGDGNLRTYELTSDRVPRDAQSVRSTIWQSTASMMLRGDDLNDMFRTLFKDFDEMFAPLSREERKSRRSQASRGSSKTPRHIPTVKSQRVTRVKIRAYENRTPLIENDTTNRKEIHEADKTRVHMGFIRLYRLVLMWSKEQDSARQKWASHIITSIVRIRSSLKPPYREEQKRHLKTMLKLMLKSFRHHRHRTSYSDREEPIFRLTRALRTRDDGHLCRECFEILSSWFDDSSFQDDQGKTIYKGVSFSSPFGGLKSGEPGKFEEYSSRIRVEFEREAREFLSLNLSITQSLNHSITQSLNHSITQSLNLSITQSLNHSITRTLTLTNTQFSLLLTRTLKHTRTHKVTFRTFTVRWYEHGYVPKL